MSRSSARDGSHQATTPSPTTRARASTTPMHGRCSAKSSSIPGSSGSEHPETVIPTASTAATRKRSVSR